MRKNLLLLAFFFSFTLGVQAVSVNIESYNYSVDLTQADNDQLTVTLDLNDQKLKKGQKIVFTLPAIVPGTYSISDYGRFVTSFKALDAKGRELKVKKKGNNAWVISKGKKGKKLAKIVYTVEDSWDTSISDNVVFEPSGTNFEAGKNFVINNHCLFGFFEGQELLPYNLSFTRPSNFFGATSLKQINTSTKANTDVFYADNYHYLVDAPIMYCEPDTATLRIGDTDVLISTYSKSKQVSSAFVASRVKPLLEAQRIYLGGTLPVDRYAFLIYINDAFYQSGAYGALEHSYSSLYTFLDDAPENIAQTVTDIAAHEFFHIVTPLNIHSEEIQNFDFTTPQMSKHLWLYEGVTEYSSSHVQVQQQMISIEEYLNVLASKMRGADQYKDDLPFTVMSKECLKKYEDQYGNVYEKGALIGMCLDLQIRILSEGEKGIRDLLDGLSGMYGKDKAFKDDELFDKIEELTYPGVRKFLDVYVAGPKALPIERLLKEAGIVYEATAIDYEISLGISPRAVGFDGTHFFIKGADGIDEFGKDLGFEVQDKIKVWNGEALNIKNINQVLGGFMMSASEGNPLEVVVEREGKDVTLKTEVKKVGVEKKHGLSVMEEATAKQLKIRKQWLGDYTSEADKE